MRDTSKSAKMPPWSKGYPVFLRHPARHYRHASEGKRRAVHLVHARLRKFTRGDKSRVRHDCGERATGGMDTIFSRMTEAVFPGPFHARFNARFVHTRAQ